MFGVLEPLQKAKQEEQGQCHSQQKVTSNPQEVLLSLRSHTVGAVVS